VASDVAWLLGESHSQTVRERLLDGYLAGLSEKGFVKRACSVRKVREEALNMAYAEFFPPSFLRLYDQNVARGHDRPYGFIRRLSLGRPGFLTRHLMMIQFLGHSAESFFGMLAVPRRVRRVNDHRPFGEAPWPCLNPVAPHARQLTVKTCDVTRSEKGGDLLAGTFSCGVCGFVYRRPGPDMSPDDRLRFESIRAYGPVWEESLKTFWEDQSLSVFRMAGRLGIRDHTVKSQALRLGLPFPRVGPHSSVVGAPRKALKTLTRRHGEWLKRRDSYRKEWLSAFKKNPEITRSALASLQRRVYSWLHHHDREWLDRHKPAARYTGGERRFDWECLDSQIAAEVRREADRLKKPGGRPVRVTKSLVARNIDRFQTIMRAAGKLPLTAEAFKEIVDSRRDFDVRRLGWAARHLRQEGIPLTKTALIKLVFGTWPDVDTVAIAEDVLRNADEQEASPALEAA
jgi:hypothetical protein